MIRSTRRLSISGDERRWLKVFQTLNEFQARLFAADKALDLGRGGISRLAALTGLSRTTITKAVEELESGGKLVSVGEGRARRVGGGRKKIEGVDPGGGVDSFRAPSVVGDSSALPGRYGVFFTGQPEVERGAAARGSGCSIPVHQPAGESRVKEGRPRDLGGRQEEGIGG